jgi:D-alanyl-D-alanine carboxypeptidase (penicillin-binding protein 5/6)
MLHTKKGGTPAALPVIILLVFSVGRAGPLYAQIGPSIESRAAVIIDAETGFFLPYFKNADESIPPASLTKLVTMHIVLEDVAAGRLSLERRLPPPKEAWAVNQPPHSSLMFLAEGQIVSLHDLLLGLAVPSGNDAAVAAALRAAPTVDAFVERMNRAVSELGLFKTRFVEPSGVSELNMTTAREFARFACFYLKRHPETTAEYHSVQTYSYPLAEHMAPPFRGRPPTITQHNRNRLLGTVAGVDGLKTGFIDESGYNIALTAKRGDTRFIAVILGAQTGPGGEDMRDRDGTRLIEWAFSNYRTVHPDIGTIPPVRVYKGAAASLAVQPGAPLAFTTQTTRAAKLRYTVTINEPLTAPLSRGDEVGRITFSDSEGALSTVPLAAAEDLPRGNFFRRLIDSIRLFFW